MDVEKAKNDIIYFAENAMGYQLQDWQKDLLLKYQQGAVIFWGGYRTGKNMVLETIKQHKKIIVILRTKNEDKEERMRKKNTLYALYKGDDLVMMGRVDEIAKELNVTIESVYRKAWRTNKGIYKKSKYEVVRLEGEMEND